MSATGRVSLGVDSQTAGIAIGGVGDDNEIEKEMKLTAVTGKVEIKEVEMEKAIEMWRIEVELELKKSGNGEDKDDSNGSGQNTEQMWLPW